MSDLMTADLATGADDSSFSSSPTESASSLLDKALFDDDAPSTDAANPATTPGEKPSDRGDGRDPKGRFAPTRDEPRDVIDGKIQPPAGPTAAAKPGETPAAPVVESRPFQYRAMGKTHALDGAKVGDNGDITIPAAKTAELREAYNALHQRNASFVPTMQKLQSENTRLERELTDAKQGSGVNDAKAAKLVDGLSAIMREPDDNKFMEAVWNMRQKWESLVTSAERDHWRAQAERGAAPVAAAPAPQASAPSPTSMPSADVAKQTTFEHLEHAKIDHTFRDVTAEDWQQLSTRYAATPFAFLRLATADDAKQHPGVQPGSVVFDTDALASDIQAFAKAQAAQRATARGQAELAAKNATRTQATISAPPSAGGTHAPPKRPGGKMSREEYEAWKNTDDIDDD